MSNQFSSIPYDAKLNITDIDPRIGTHNGDGDYSLSFVKATKILNLNDDEGVKSSVFLDINGGVSGEYLELSGGTITGNLNIEQELTIANPTTGIGTLNFGTGTTTDGNDLSIIKTQDYGLNKTEMVIYKGNNPESQGFGPDRVRLKGANIILETYQTSEPEDITIDNVRTNLLIDGVGDIYIYGNLDAGNNRVFTSHVPNFNSDLVNLLYLNQRLSEKLSLTGGTMTGGINMSQNRITNMLTANTDDGATTKKYVDDAIIAEGEKYVPKTGGTFTGNVGLDNAELLVETQNAKYGITHKHGTTQMATYINNSSPTAHCQFGTLSNDALSFFVNSNSGVMRINTNSTVDLLNHKIVSLATPISDNDGANKKYVDDAIAGELLQSFKTYNVTGRQFSNFGMWSPPLPSGDFYTKGLKLYIPTNPVVSTEMVNDSIKKSDAYQVLTTPKQNPSLFQFYGIVYQDLSVSTIKKGRLQVKLNIPYVSDVDVYTQDTFMIQGILGNKISFDANNNASVTAYGVQTVNSVHGYSGGNIYGRNIDDSFSEWDQKWIREIELLFNFTIPIDIPTNQLYIYLQPTTNLNALQNRYINFLFGGLTSPIASTTSRDLMISGTAIYTKQNNDFLSDETVIDPSATNLNTATLTDEHYHYTVNSTNYAPIKTYNNIDVIETRDISNQHIHAVQLQGISDEEIALFNNGSDPAIFDGSKIPVDNIFECSIKLKTDTINQDISVNIQLGYLNNEGDTLLDVSSIDYTISLYPNNDNFNNYTIPIRRLIPDKYLVTMNLFFKAGDKVGLDDFEIHYIDVSGNIKELHAYFKVENNTSVLHSAREDDKKDLTDRVAELEKYIEQLKQTYTIE